jgi:hypothetical protein
MSAMLKVLGTLLPFAGMALTLVLAAATRGLIRWLVLALVPLVTFAICYMFAEAIAYNGNMLFVALFSLLVVLLMVYYPCLLLAGIIVLLRRRKADIAQHHSVSSP